MQQELVAVKKVNFDTAYREDGSPTWLCDRGHKLWTQKLDRIVKGAMSASDYDTLAALCNAEVEMADANAAVRANGSTFVSTTGRMEISPWARNLHYWTRQHDRMLVKCKFLRMKQNQAPPPKQDNPFTDLLVIDDALVNDTTFESEFVDKSDKYMRDVLVGKIPACQEIKWACERHLKDLDNKKLDYRFSAYKAHRVCAFISKLPHVKGKWAKQKDNRLIVLQPWQCWIVCMIFGWVHKATGLRRFTEVYLEICRKNGKSVLAAAIGLYMLVADGEAGAEVYSGATTEKQAWEVFRPARLMMLGTPELIEAAGVDVLAKELSVDGDGSRFETMIGKPGDGASPSCAIIDEYHEHDAPDQVDTMKTGMLAREQPLLLQITTAGYNLAGPCYETRLKCVKVLEGALKEERMFIAIYSIDLPNENQQKKGDEWSDPKVLAKANPNLGVSVDLDFLLAAQRSAVLTISEQTRFKTKHLNVWCAARNAWISLQQWQEAAMPNLKMEQMKGDQCWFIFDLASKLDIAAYIVLFMRIIDDLRHYYCFGKYYLPEEQAETPSKNQLMYQKWHKQGILTLTNGATTDFERIRDDIIADALVYDPEEVVYDPFNATHMSQLLMGEGLELVEFVQKPQNFAVPMDEVQAALKDKRFHHDGNEAMTWMISNVTVRPAKKGLFWPTKEAPESKIDGPVAMIMGVARASGVEGADEYANALARPVTA